jgi:phospholipid transport system substrate-binding protein
MQVLSSLLVGIACCLLHMTPAWAASPRDDLQASVAGALARIEDPALTLEQRTASARAAIREMFDFSNAARRAFGDHWLRLTPVQRRDVTWLFGGFVTDVLAARAGYLSPGVSDRLRDRITYRGQSVVGDRAAVRFTWTHGSDDIPLQADMVRRGKLWRVDDLWVQGVSVVDNYRAQVDRLMRDGSYTELVERLKLKRAALATLTVKAP